MKQFRDIGSLSFLSFAGIVTSLCYTIAVAIVFGVSRDVEIFFAASQVFMVFAALAQAGQLTEAFIPIFQKIKVEQSVEQAHRAAGVMFVWLLVFATIVATLVFIFSKAIVSVQVSGFYQPSNKPYLYEIKFVTSLSLLLQRDTISPYHGFTHDRHA